MFMDWRNGQLLELKICFSHWNFNGYTVTHHAWLCWSACLMKYGSTSVAEEKGLDIAMMLLWCIIDWRPLYAIPLLHWWCRVYIQRRRSAAPGWELCVNVCISRLFLCSLSLLLTRLFVHDWNLDKIFSLLSVFYQKATSGMSKIFIFCPHTDDVESAEQKFFTLTWLLHWFLLTFRP